MQVVFYFGVLYMDENRFQMCLGKNCEFLVGMDIVVFCSGQFCKQLCLLMIEVLNVINLLLFQQDFLYSIIGGDCLNWIIFLVDNFLGFFCILISENEFFSGFFNCLVSFFCFFEDVEVELFYVICNLVIFMQVLMVVYKGDDFGVFMGYSDLMVLCWFSYFECVIEDCLNM